MKNNKFISVIFYFLVVVCEFAEILVYLHDITEFLLLECVLFIIVHILFSWSIGDKFKSTAEYRKGINKINSILIVTIIIASFDVLSGYFEWIPSVNLDVVLGAGIGFVCLFEASYYYSNRKAMKSTENE